MKRAAATVVGTVLVLIGSFILVTGVVLLTIFGLDGRSQSEAVRAVASSTALVMDPQRADAGLPGSLELTTFTVSATAIDRRETFIGIGPADDVLAYLSGAPYDIARGVDGRASTLDQISVEGSGRPLPPGSQSFWTQQTSGSGTQQLVVALGSADQLLVIMNPEGAAPVDVRLVASVEAAWIGPAGIAASAAGAAVLLIGLWLLLGRRADTEGAATTPSEGTGTPPSVSTTPSEWGSPVAANDVPASAPPPSSGPGTAGPVTAPPVSLVDLTAAAAVPAQRVPTSIEAEPASVAASPRSGGGPDGPPREPGE